MKIRGIFGSHSCYLNFCKQRKSTWSVTSWSHQSFWDFTSPWLQSISSNASISSCKIINTINSFPKSFVSAVETKEVALQNMILMICYNAFPIFGKNGKLKMLLNRINILKLFSNERFVLCIEGKPHMFLKVPTK